MPKDLKGNFETHRLLGNGNARVSAKKFINMLASSIAVQALKGDLNSDGFLNATEAKKLPKGVRDNFANYVAFR